MECVEQKGAISNFKRHSSRSVLGCGAVRDNYGGISQSGKPKALDWWSESVSVGPPAGFPDVKDFKVVEKDREPMPVGMVAMEPTQIVQTDQYKNLSMGSAESANLFGIERASRLVAVLLSPSV